VDLAVETLSCTMFVEGPAATSMAWCSLKARYLLKTRAKEEKNY
jgi:hypothetical protein